MSKQRLGYATPNTTLTAVGAIAYDVKELPADGFGLKYWPLVMRNALKTFKDVAPLAVWLCFNVGIAIVIQATNVLGLIGADRGLAGVAVGALGLREIAINVSLLAVAASAGAGFVTELGAMRVSEEIDALEVMAINSHAYLVATRVLGALIAAAPIVIFCIASTFFGGWLAAWAQRGVMSQGSFFFFFWKSLSAPDFFLALIKGVTLAVVTCIICLSQGYRASGGPVGVGLAVGRALDLSIVTGIVLNLALTYIFWGTKDTLSL